ncbi:B3 domain-containing protein Os01g0234100-like [Prunus avium]|uniref:B3 domain-containing protein Os01g0234100-like n=1 Tax=Prunus avium TaxID=42229 RepID=A0A6P5U0Q6_PRUAV|nr:B3 domain-containing protein Os01g0234100-like [Prunus avium]XP_021832685.1 B3 domain-containing protein Os01g0234100-like [Prunus avium]
MAMREPMAVLQDQNRNFSYPPSESMKMEKLSGQKSSCLELMALSNVVNVNPIMSQSHKRKRVITRVKVESLYDSSQAQSSVMARAKEVEASLDPKFPVLLKVMMPSHVTGGFCLSIPKKFSCQHLPKQDTMIVLEDEDGKEFETKYLVEKCGLSGGWRGFSIAHKLLQGDIVIFHIVAPFKIKVYIVRSNGLDEVDCGHGLMSLDACAKQIDAGQIIPYETEKSGPVSDQSENDSEDLSFEFMDGLRLAESDVTFKEVKCMENFTVVVNGLVINSEFSKYILTKYFELCCSQNAFLHEHLLEGLNCKLIAGVISETVNIADAIRACKITTTEGDFSTWSKTLKAFEDLGMSAGFLRARLDRLSSLASESKRLKEARLEKDHPEEEMRSLDANPLEVKETINMTSEKLELTFQEVAKAPW